MDIKKRSSLSHPTQSGTAPFPTSLRAKNKRKEYGDKLAVQAFMRRLTRPARWGKNFTKITNLGVALAV